MEIDEVLVKAIEEKEAKAALKNPQTPSEEITDTNPDNSVDNNPDNSLDEIPDNSSGNKDIFGNDIKAISLEVEQEQIKPEVVQEYKTKAEAFDLLVESDPLIKNYISAKQSNEINTFKEWLNKAIPKEYSANNPREVFDAYWTKQDPSINQEGLDAEWHDFTNGRETLSRVQLKTVSDWVKELNQGHELPVFKPAVEQPNAELMEKDVNNFNKWKESRNGYRIFSEDGNTGGFQFKEKHVKDAEILLRKAATGNIKNEDGTTANILYDVFLTYVAFNDILSTISESSESNGALKILKKNANMRQTDNPATLPSSISTPPTEKEKIKKSSQELYEFIKNGGV